MGKKSQIKNIIIVILLALLLTSCGTVKKHTSDNTPATEITAATNIPVASKISVENTSSPYTVTGKDGTVENDAIVIVYTAGGKTINSCNATSSGAFQFTVDTVEETVVLSATAPNKQESAKTTIGLVQI